MNTSVIVPTYQGEGKISNIIDALSNQTFLDFEIIIAIDGSTDSTASIAREKLKDFPNHKVILQENKGRSCIRNYGAKEAAGDLLIFYDDDMRPFQDSVEKHIHFHSYNKNQILQGALLTDSATISTDVLRYKSELDVKWNKSLIEDGINDQHPYLSAAHFSIPKIIFDEINGFDEKLTDSEDFDMSIRLLEQDYSIIYDNNNQAFHDDRITLKSYIKRKRDYTSSHKMLNALYPERYHKYFQRTFIPRTGYKALIYKIISLKSIVRMIDSEHPIIMWIPKKLRYRIYDVVIQGLANYYPNKPL